jgi:hypothetical protein
LTNIDLLRNKTDGENYIYIGYKELAKIVADMFKEKMSFKLSIMV